ncbi:putative inactive G-type lectin S-receptor-like serine/threonine-protein kinase SRK [Dichanthelium oligosanthes]|uniref:non-specific serine/threonine protein kinase n=1 Tax=Dichanthelium oligosanthes TaxID=888268 RepID=A0A1E5UW57_9POAL|nr:putative inactive G-type lectin S-receptor-like serine/threonine-protein kinase SRK [Dichanthelium oligosanthes]
MAQDQRSPVWSNYLVVGSCMGSIKSTIYMTVRRVEDEICMSFGMPGGSSTVKIKMDFSGKIKILVWNSTMLEWNVLEAEPNHECSTYGCCGSFGYCDNAEAIATCKCLDGFEPVDNKDWIDGKFSEGCRRKELLRCGRENRFLTMTAMKISDRFVYVKNRSLDECSAECTSNCSCTAYAYANMSTTAINGDATRCLLWMGDLIDTEKRIGEGENLYIRVNRLSGIARGLLYFHQDSRLKIIHRDLKANNILLDDEMSPKILILMQAWSLWKDGKTKDFVDSSIVETCSLDETSRCIHVGLLCVQDNPNARPLMSSVVSILENGDTSLPPPKQPVYFAERNYATCGQQKLL